MDLPLKQGATFSLLEGPETGRLLLMIHGATVPHWEFDQLVPHLHKANWQTLRMDLYGHGRSARPERDYTISLFTEQIWEALSYLRTKTGISVLGHSLGAVIAVNLVQQHPEFFRHLLLVAPMLDFISKQWWSRLLQVPGLGEWMMRKVVITQLRKRRQRRYSAIGVESFIPRFEEQLAYPGFDRSLLSMFRCGTLADQGMVYRNCGSLAKDVAKFLLWGEEDHVVSRQDIEKICALIGPHQMEIMPGTEHNLFITHPEQVAAKLLSFLEGTPTMSQTG